MAAVAGDVTHIQDEELLRRMWQDTEDFGRKKEIRARMYKLREQRLKEFYTTGEVLSDVLTTGNAALEENQSIIKSRSASTISNRQQEQVIHKTSAYTTTSSTGGNFAITHADSLADEGFMTLKSKEIRDSESPTRDFHRRQQKNQSNSETISSQDFQNFSSQDDGGNVTWKVSQESSSGNYKATGQMGDDGNMVVHSTTRTEHRNVTGGSDTDGLTGVTQVSTSENTSTIPGSDRALRDSSDNDMTSVVLKENVGGRSVSSSTSQKWSSSKQSQREERVSTTSSSSTSSRMVHKDSGFSDDFQSKDGSGETTRKDSTTRKESINEQTGSRKSSLTTDQNGSRKSSLTTPGGKHRITQRSSTTEVPFGDLGGVTDDSKTVKVGEKISIDINVAGTKEERQIKTAEQHIMTELHDLDSYLSTQKSVSTPASPGDASSWTVVSTQQSARTGDNDKTEEFVFHVGRKEADDTTVHDSSAFITQERSSTVSSRGAAASSAPKSREQSPEKKTATATTPTEPKKGIMKQPSQDKMDTTGQYVTTYTEHFTNKRISVDTDPTHDAFARSLRSSPERSTPTSTRSSSKMSLDRASPTRNYRNKTSADSSLASLNRVSPSRKSPGTTTTDKSTNRPTSPAKSIKGTPRGESPDKNTIRSNPGSPVKGLKERSPNLASRESSPEKIVTTVTTTRSSTERVNVGARGVREQSSPVRSTSPGKPTRRSSSARNSPDKDVLGETISKRIPSTADKNSKQPSRRVSAGDKPKSSVTSTISTSSTIKEKRRLSSGVTRAATKKRCSTPGTSPTREERQSRPRSRGSSRSVTGSDGSDSESKTFTRETDEETRRYQQSVIGKEDELLSTTRKEIDVDQGTTVVLNVTTLLQHERDSEFRNKIQQDNLKKITVGVTPIACTSDRAVSETEDDTLDAARPLERETSPAKSSPRSVNSPALDKLVRDKSPEYSSEGSLASELTRRPVGKGPRVASPVKQVRGVLESSDSSPERRTFEPIERFKTNPEDGTNTFDLPTTHAVKPTPVSPSQVPSSIAFIPAKPLNSRTAVPSEDVQDTDATPTVVKEPIKPGKPINTRPKNTKMSPERPNASPSNANNSTSPRTDEKIRSSSNTSKPKETTPKDRSSSPVKHVQKPVGRSSVPEVTRRSPTPESLSRRGNRDTGSSSVSPCSSPERQSDRENSRPKGITRKPIQKKKAGDTDKPSRVFVPDKESPSRPPKSNEKAGLRKNPDVSPAPASPKYAGPQSERPQKVSPQVRRESLPRRSSKDNTPKVKPQYSDSSPERESPERRPLRTSQKTPTNSDVHAKGQPKYTRPSSIPRAGQKTPTNAEKPLDRKPSWSKTLRGAEPPRESNKSMKPSAATAPIGTRSVSADSKMPTQTQSAVRKPATPTFSRPQRRGSSPATSPERIPKTKSKSAPFNAAPTQKSAFVRTNSKPSDDGPEKDQKVTPKQGQPSNQPRFTTTTKLTPKCQQSKPRYEEDFSTDRSSTVSSPETIMPARNKEIERTEEFINIVRSEETAGEQTIHFQKVTQDYFSDECDDLLDETPPEEFSVEEDSPADSKTKLSSIPTPSKKAPTIPTKNSKNKVVDKEPMYNRPITSTPTNRANKPAVGKQPELKKTPSKSEVPKVSRAPECSYPGKAEQSKTFRSVATVETRITRANSDKNVIRRQSPSPSSPVNRRQVPKVEQPISRLADKKSNVNIRSSVRQQVNTVTSVTTRLTASKTSKTTTTTQKTSPKEIQVVKRPKAVGTVTKATKTVKQTVVLGTTKRFNGAPRKPDCCSSCSEDDEGLPEKCPSIIDTDDEEYSREMEELRRDEESQYASKVTSREDAHLSICQDKLKTSRDSLTIVDIRLKSSRESSPDSRGPRYADRVSEPETDDDYAKKPDAVRFQRPILQPHPLGEESDESNSAPNGGKLGPTVYPKSILSGSKSASPLPEKQTYSPRDDEERPKKPSEYLKKTAQGFPQGDPEPVKLSEYPVRNQDDFDDNTPKKPSEYLKKSPQESLDLKRLSYPDDELTEVPRPTAASDSPQLQTLQVTDLDESDVEECLRLEVSVSDRVTHFLDASKALVKTPEPQTSEPSRNTNLDSPSAVNKARAMFETIATTQLTTTSAPKQIDILSRPSVFEARRNGPWADKVDASPTKNVSRETPKRPKTNIDHDSPVTSYVNEYPSDDDTKPLDDTNQGPVSSSEHPTKTSKDTYPRDKSPTGKISTDTYPKRRPSLSADHPAKTTPKDSYPRDKSPTGKTPTDSYSRRQPSISPERPAKAIPKDSYPRDKFPTGNTPTDSYSRRPPSISPERPAKTSPKDTYPRDKSPTGKISTDTYTRRKPSISPERPTKPTRDDTFLQDKSPTGKISTDTYTRRKPLLSEERPIKNTPKDTYSQDKSPTGAHSRRNPSVSPERPAKTSPSDSYPEDKSPTGTYSRRNPSISPERSAKTSPKDSYLQDKSPTGKVSSDTHSRRKPSSSPERSPHVSPTDSSPEEAPSTKGFPRRSSVDDRTGPSTTRTPVEDSQLPGKLPSKSLDKYASFPSQTRGSRTKIDETPSSLTKKTSLPASSTKCPIESPTAAQYQGKPSKDELPDVTDILLMRRDNLVNTESRLEIDLLLPRRDSIPLKDITRRDSIPSKDTARRDSIPMKDTARRDSIPSKETARRDSISSKGTTRRDSIPSKETARRDSIPLKDTTRRDSIPSKEIQQSQNETLASPSRRESLPKVPTQDLNRRTSPNRQDKDSPNVNATRGSPERDYLRKNSSPKAASPTRDYTGKDVSSNRKRKDSLPKDSKRIVSLETSSSRGSGVFGVALRSTTEKTETAVQRRRSDAKVVEEDENIEEIFELDVLETMLEKAVGYDKRRRIRAQIRIVRRQLEVSSTTTTTRTTSAMTSSTGVVEKTNSVSTQGVGYRTSSRRDPRPQEATTKTLPTRGVEGKPQQATLKRSEVSPQREPLESKPQGRKPSDTTDYRKRSEVSPQREPLESKSQGRKPSDTTDYLKRSPSPTKISPVAEVFSSKPGTVDNSTNFVKKHSRTELTIELKPATKNVKTPAKKWSTGDNKPQEACPVTSSYGVGPTDENGRPLFGLRALRKSHNSQSQIDFVESTPSAPEPEPEDNTDSYRDGNGLPLFGGLRALKVGGVTSNSTSCSVVSSVTRTATRRDSGSIRSREDGDEMPEQPESPQLRHLVNRHEQRVRGKDGSQPLQKPKAKLRDSFILPSTTAASSKPEEFLEEPSRSAAQHRASSLRSLIQKHESIAKDDELNVIARPGILKKPRDEVVSHSSYSKSTVVTSRGTMRPDGSVSLTRDIIRGETVQRPGEEPVTTVTRTQQCFDTPDEPLAIEEIVDDEVSTRVSGDDRKFTASTTLRSQVAGKTSPTRSPERNDQRHLNDKYVSSTTATVTRKTSPVSTPKSAGNKTPSSVRRQIFNDDDDQLTNKSTSTYTSSSTVTSSTTKQVSNVGQRSSVTGVEDRRTSQGYIVDYNDDDESDGYQGSNKLVEDASKTSSPRATPDRVIPGYNSQKTESKVFTSSARRRSSTPLEDGQRTPGGTRTITRGNSIRALQEKFQQAAGSADAKEPVSLDTRSTAQTETSSRSFIGNQTRVTGVQDILDRMRNADHVVESGDTVEDSEARALLNKFLGAQVILQGMEPLVASSQHGSSLVTQVERQMEPLVKVGTQSATLVNQVERQRVMSTSSSTSATTKKVQAKSSVTNGRTEDIEEIWDEGKLRRLLDDCTDYEGRRQIRARLRVVMAEQKACSEIVSAALADQAASSDNTAAPNVELRSNQESSESTTKSSTVDGNVTTKTEVTTKTSSFSSTAVGSSRVATKAPSGKTVSPFAKFQQLDRQNSKSAPNSPKTPVGETGGPLFKFTDPQLCRSASTVKDRLLYWCQVKTKEYKNIQIDNFSTCWSNGLAFCALVHHFLPDAFDYDALKPEERRKNFELAFRIADDKAGIAPLLDVEDMVMMRKPDWKCVFTYVQSIYRRFKDQD